MAGRAYQGISLNQIEDKATRDALRAVDLYLRDQRGPTSSTSADTGGIAQESFVVLSTASTLTDERVLAVTAPLTKVDTGPGGTLTLALTLAALGGTPALTYGTTVLAGSATTFLRTDDRVKFPTALMSSGTNRTLTLTDDGSNQTLSGIIGDLKIVPAKGMEILFPPDTEGNLTLVANSTTAAAVLLIPQGRPVAGTRAIIQPVWFSAGSADVFSNQIFNCWDAQFNTWTSGKITDCTIAPYGASVVSILPSSGSGGGNKLYVYSSSTFAISNANATWDEVATGLFKGIRRGVFSPTITTQAGVIIEPPTAATSDQIGLLIRQQAAQTTAAVRSGIDVLEQNSGTDRYAARLYNQTLISNPSGRAETALLLRQLNTGATAGAHANFDDKAGDPPSPVTGDLWRNGNALYFRQAAATVDLTAAAAGGGDSFLEWAL